MSEHISGEVQYVKKNDYGFWSVKVDDVWYGAGKANPGVSEGDEVEFSAYENDKGYMQVKGKIKGGSGPSKASGGGSGGGGKFKGKSGGGGGNKPAVDWDAKDARISYQGAHKIAVTEVQLLLTNGAIKLPTKQTDIMGAIQALVDETAQRIFALSYAAKQPSPILAKAAKAKAEAKDAHPDTDEGTEDDDDAGWSDDEE